MDLQRWPHRFIGKGDKCACGRPPGDEHCPYSTHDVDTLRAYGAPKGDRIAAELRAEPFPLQHGPPHSIPWGLAERAHAIYVRDYYGYGQSVERIAQRRGFSVGEMDMFLPGWREEVR